jgi:hypothetical protein
MDSKTKLTLRELAAHLKHTIDSTVASIESLNETCPLVEATFLYDMCGYTGGLARAYCQSFEPTFTKDLKKEVMADSVIHVLGLINKYGWVSMPTDEKVAMDKRRSH